MKLFSKAKLCSISNLSSLFILRLYYSWRLTKPKSSCIRGSDLMSLNNSRGFPSILLVNFSILYTAGQTKLSKNGKKNMRLFDILSRSTKNKEQCLWLFYTGYSRKKYACERKNRLPRENVPRFCIEPSTTSV